MNANRHSIKPEKKSPPLPICFSFAHALKECAEIKGEYFLVKLENSSIIYCKRFGR
jgi:hypothetical protein